MKKITIFVMLGILLASGVTIAATADRFVYAVLASGVTDPTQNTTNPNGNGWAITNTFGNDCPSCACSSHEHQYHPGYDISQSNCAGKPVYAVANGTVSKVANVMADPNDHSRGYYILIKHTLPQTEAMSQYFLNGTTVPPDFQNTDHLTSAYLHVDDVLVQEGDQVSLGQQIAEIFDATSFGDHLHFEIRANWDTRLVSPEDCLGYYDTKQDISDFGYIKGWSFIGDRLISTVYRCQWDSQNPSDITVQPGDIINIWVKYRNTGTEYWTNNQNVGDPHSVELWSCDASGTIVNSWFEPVNWVGCPGACSDRRVTGADETTVNPNGIATFTFQAKVPDNAQPQDVRVWFRPTHGGQVMDDWGGMNIYIHVRNPPPPGVSLSFEDSNGDNTPDGWLQVAFNGGMYNYPSGGAVDGSRYVSFTHTNGSQWNAIGTPASGIIAAGTLYRLEFWYRTTSTSLLSWRLGASDIAAASLPINCTVSSPLNDGQWHHFWSAPFSVSGSDLANYPNLAFYYDYGTIGTVDIDWVNVIPTAPCP